MTIERFDHAVVAVRDLDAAIAARASARTPRPGRLALPPAAANGVSLVFKR